MKNGSQTHRFVFAVMIAILILAICILPWPERVEVRMCGIETSSDGSCLGNGDIVIRGIRYNYFLREDQLTFDELKIFNMDLVPLSNTSIPISSGEQLGNEPSDYISVLVMNVSPNRETYGTTYTMVLVMDEAQQWCSIRLQDLFGDTERHFESSKND